MSGQLSQVRRPRPVLRIGGVPVQPISIAVENRAHFTADTWRAELEPWQQPQGYGLRYWADAPAGLRVELLVGLLQPTDSVAAQPSSLTSLLVGQVDDIEIDPIGGTLSLSGRDLTAVLIDTKTSNKWPDHVASWIVTQLAIQAGLTPQVTATTAPVGPYYRDAYVSLAKEVPMWDLITFLAQQEGFDTYVTGTTLYFGPPQADSDPRPWTISVQRAQGGITSNALSLKLRRSLTLAGDMSVTVLSHSSQTGRTVKVTAARAGKKAPQSSASRGAERTQNYTIRRPGLTQEQAQQLATATLADLSKFERTLDVTMQGDPSVSVRRAARLIGTGTSFDARYYLSEVNHTIDATGYAMTAHLKNHPTAGEAAL
jgi:phage protein D